MLVIIESTVGGNVAGFLQCNVSGNETISTLIDNYCESKGISIGPNFVLRDQKGILLDNRRTVSACQIKHGDTLYLENQGWKNEIFHFTNWWLLACVAILISVGGFSIAVSLHLLTGPTPIQYGVVLDGGSSHTGLFVYEWPGPKWNGTGVLRQIGLCNSVGDISKFYSNVSAVDSFLTPCLTYASNLIPSTSHSTTPIYFAATAGLRLLNMSNPNGAIVLLEAVRNRLIRSGFKFQDSNVQILSGSEEAGYGWVSVNFLMEKIGPHVQERVKVSELETLGALDLGGASTQMSFETLTKKRIPAHSFGSTREHETKSLQFYGSNYSVFSESMLCYGMREIVKRYVSVLVVNASGTVQSPCHPLGYLQEVSVSQVFDSPCAINHSETHERWTLNGTSNYEQCTETINQLFNITYCQSNFINETCFHNQNQTDYEQNFVAFSTFNYVKTELNITKDGSLDEFKQKVSQVCTMTMDELENLGANATFSSLLCLESQYVLSLLTTGYGFNEKNWEKILFTNLASDAELGWSMGFMIDKTNSIPATVSSVFLNTPAFISLSILFGLFFTVGCLLSYHAIRMKRSAHSYSRLRSRTYGSLNLSL